MKKYTLTTFGSKSNVQKMPVSPYNDRTFKFINKHVSNLKDAFEIMSDNFILSKPLIKTNFISRKKIKYLEEHFSENINYIVLDLDKIYSKDDVDYIIDYFKINNYSCIIGESRSYNDTDYFSLKGLLQVKCTNTSYSIKYILDKLQKDLGDTCEVDLTAKNKIAHQAPITKNNVLYYQEDGIVLEADIKKPIEESIEKITIPVSDDLVQECIHHFESMGFRVCSSTPNDGAWQFSHPSEVKTPGGYFWFISNPFSMHHNDESKTKNIFKEMREHPAVKRMLKARQKEEITNMINNNISAEKVISVDERYLKVTDEIHDIIDTFVYSTKSVIKITSPMGTAKSVIINEVIEQSHDNDLRVLVVSNRVSVAEDFSKKYNMNWYKSETPYKKGDSIVVQFDSLWKYSMKEFDVVVMDEFMSLLLHHRSDLTSKHNLNVVKFFSALNGKKKLVIADAFLTGLENMFLPKCKTVNIVNKYRDDIELKNYNDKHYLIDEISKQSKLLNKQKSEKISCSFSNLSVMKAVRERLKKEGVNIMTLSSETHQNTRDLIYQYFEQDAHDKWDVLMFTPTLTVGVSNLNNITHHFHIDKSNAGDVISSLQMTKRSRCASTIHYSIDETFKNQSTNLTMLLDVRLKNIMNYYTGQDKSFLIDFDEDGDFTLSPVAKYMTKIELLHNILENFHSFSFELLLQKQFKNVPEIISTISNYDLRDDNRLVKINEKSERERALKSHALLKFQNLNEKDPFDMEILEVIESIMEDIKADISKDDLYELVNLEFKENGFIKKTKKFSYMVKNDRDNIKKIMSNMVGTNLCTINNSNSLEYYEYLTSLKIDCFYEKYTKNQIAEIDKQHGVTRFATLLRSIGYKYNKDNGQMIIDPNIKRFSTFFLN